MRRFAVLAAVAALAACAGARPAPEAPAAVDWTRLPAIADWTARVKTAQATADHDKRRDLFVALAREALEGTGRKVHVAGTKSPQEAHPDDYLPVPALNFDVDLNGKTSRKFTPATQTRSLKNNAGYYFSHRRVPYVVLGPGAINPADPDFLRMYVDHELYHAGHHVGDKRPLADRELEAWVRQFRHWFYKIRQHRQRWGPMIEYYEEASASEQAIALDALTGYYRDPPPQYVPAGNVEAARKEFTAWLKRRTADPALKSKKLIQDLAKRIG